jgi:phospholipid-translocating ATPase
VPHSVLQKSSEKNSEKKPKSTARKPLDKRWHRSVWEDVKVGDYVCLRNDDSIPADILVLSTSEQDGLCYVETQNLDGETNLKIMRSLQATNEISTPEDCEQSSFYVECEPPHPNLYTFNGALKWKVDGNDLIRTETTRRRQQVDEAFVKTSESSEETTVERYPDDETLSDSSINQVAHEKTEAITASSVLLRGCVLRNTGWVIGLVLFTGNETKIMLNSGKTPSKRSKMEKATNPYVSATNFFLIGLY